MNVRLLTLPFPLLSSLPSIHINFTYTMSHETHDFVSSPAVPRRERVRVLAQEGRGIGGGGPMTVSTPAPAPAPAPAHTEPTPNDSFPSPLVSSTPAQHTPTVPDATVPRLGRIHIHSKRPGGMREAVPTYPLAPQPMQLGKRPYPSIMPTATPSSMGSLMEYVTMHITSLQREYEAMREHIAVRDAHSDFVTQQISATSKELRERVEMLEGRLEYMWQAVLDSQRPEKTRRRPSPPPASQSPPSPASSAPPPPPPPSLPPPTHRPPFQSDDVLETEKTHSVRDA